MNNTKILIIGSNSFSGSHFVSEALQNSHEVWGVSRSIEPNPIFLPYRWPQADTNKPLATDENFHFRSIDLNRDLNALMGLCDEVKPSYVVNFAAQGMVAQSWLNPTHWYQTNVVSQVAFHDQLRRRNYLKKYIHVTTPEVYGSTDCGWIKENNNFNPSTPYAVSRAACDLHLQSFYKAYDFPVVFTRAANVFGPGQQLYRIIPRAILSAVTNKKLNLHGGGLSKRCFIHIQDAMRATYLLLTEADSGSSWHISSRSPISIRELVQRIASKYDREINDLVEVCDERLGKDDSYLLDSSAIRKQLNWTDAIDLDEGIDDTIKWVENNLSELRDLPWDYQHKT